MRCPVEPILCGDEDGDVTMYCIPSTGRSCYWSKSLGNHPTVTDVMDASEEHRLRELPDD